MPKPIAGSYPPYYDTYIKLVNEEDLIQAFTAQQSMIDHFFDTISEEKSNYAYAPEKWTIKELLQHIIDTERIFGYRALAFARKETSSIPGFDENEYATASKANVRKWDTLCKEIKVVRQSSILLFESFNEEVLLMSGTANDNPITVKALGYALIGHIYHHKRVIEERYTK